MLPQTQLHLPQRCRAVCGCACVCGAHARVSDGWRTAGVACGSGYGGGGGRYGGGGGGGYDRPRYDDRYSGYGERRYDDRGGGGGGRYDDRRYDDRDRDRGRDDDRGRGGGGGGGPPRERSRSGRCVAARVGRSNACGWVVVGQALACGRLARRRLLRDCVIDRGTGMASRGACAVRSVVRASPSGMQSVRLAAAAAAAETQVARRLHSPSRHVPCRFDAGLFDAPMDAKGYRDWRAHNTAARGMCSSQYRPVFGRCDWLCRGRRYGRWGRRGGASEEGCRREDD